MTRPLARYRSALFAVVAALALAGAVPAADAQSEPAQPDERIAQLLQRLSADPLTPASYTAAVTMHVKLRTFPFVSMTLKGSSTYERPGIYRFSFHGFPLIARPFEQMNFDLGDPKTWPQKFDLTLLPARPNGDARLRLTPRASKIVRYVDLDVDPQKGHILRAQWSRFDDGTFVLTEHYASVGASEMCTRAEAQVAISAIRANLKIEFGDFVVRDVAAKGSDGS